VGKLHIFYETEYAQNDRIKTPVLPAKYKRAKIQSNMNFHPFYFESSTPEI